MGEITRKMFFDRQVVGKDAETYRQMLDQAAEFSNECLDFAIEVFELCAKKATANGGVVHGPVLGLARHFLACYDSTIVQFSKGITETCYPLMRSGMEAVFGVEHILKEQHENRALAYMLAGYKRRIKIWRQVDKGRKEGEKVRKDFEGDIFAPDFLDTLPLGMATDADRLEADLKADPKFGPIIAEWDRLAVDKKGNPKHQEPHWHQLFAGGHTSIAGWSKALKMYSMYWALYSKFSDYVHAGAAMEAFSCGRTRPLRHPADLHHVFQFSFTLLFKLTDSLLAFYDEQSRKTMRFHFGNKLKPTMKALWKAQMTLPGWPPPRPKR